MDVSQIAQYLQDKIVDSTKGTHFDQLKGKSLNFSDSDDERERLAEMIYEANRQKSPVVLSEMLSSVFVMHYRLEFHTNESDSEVSKLVKTVSGRIAKVMQEGPYREHNELKAAIFGAKLSKGVYRAQVVFPQIIVNAERMWKLRTMVVSQFNEDSQDICDQLMKWDQRNDLKNVFMPSDAPRGVEIPLTRTVTDNGADAPLTPVALANIVNKTIKGLPAPEHRQAWVLLGMKRAPGTEMTNWLEPREFREKKGEGKDKKGGKSGKSTDAPAGK